jgi:hypothetical protein
MTLLHTHFTTQCVSAAISIGFIAAFWMVGCANQPGDDVTCPTCNNTTELLVGHKCVPIAEVETCGPDGHAHGDLCHCFGGQQPTTINGQNYCLQQGCGESTEDVDALACDEIAKTAEPVTAVAALSEVESAHIDVGKVADVTLPANQESFAHFGAGDAGEFLAHVAAGGILGGALETTGAPLQAAVEGANEDCAAVLPEVWGIQVAAAGPVVLKFIAGTIPTVKLVIYKSTQAH